MDFYTLFNVKGQLGKGAFGEVYLVEITQEFINYAKTISLSNIYNVGEQFAAKILDLSKMNLDQIDELDREINMLIELSSTYSGNKCHNNIVCYYDKIKILKNGKEFYCIIMEYIRGFKLSDFIDNSVEDIIDPITGDAVNYYNITTKFSNSEILTFFIHLAETLDYMHSKDIVHRDIKTDNIMFNSINMKYIDFGFSCFCTLKAIKYRCRIRPMGTPPYMSPEIFDFVGQNRNLENDMDIEKLKKSDVWALGLVYYEFMYGTTPWKSDSVTDLMNEILDIDPVPFFNYEGDERLEKLVKKILHKNYNKRPTAREIIDYLKNL